MEKDRSENHNVADQNKGIVKQLNDEWYWWANSHYVLPKGEQKEVYKKDN
jgi:arylsulfatase